MGTFKAPKFKLGDKVRREGYDPVYRITAVGPRHREPGQGPWYGLSDGKPEAHRRSFRDALEHELEPIAV
jgi:hypothetical protein